MIFSDQHRNLVRGIELADSLTIDPHKWLAMPFAAGVILTSHPAILERAFSVSAPYMPKAAGAHLPDNSRISTQWTRRMNSLKLWLTLRVHGRKAYEELIDRQLQACKGLCRLGRSFQRFRTGGATNSSHRDFPAQGGGTSPQHMAAAHADIVDEVTRDGRRWISETIVKGQSVLRMMVISYLTEERHLQGLQTALADAAGKLILQARNKGLNHEGH